MNRLDRIREDLDLLRRRMITGEIDETTYDRLKVKLLSDLKYEEYRELGVTPPRGPSSGSLRVLRGGSWFNFSRYCRLALRGDLSPDNRSYVLGFRLARTSE